MLALLDFVLRHYPALESFERSTRALSRFLFPPPSLLLSEACALGNIRWLDLMWTASCTRAEDRTLGWSLTNYLRSDPHYYRWQFTKSLLAAAERGDLAIVEWLFAHFSGCEAPAFVVKAAARSGHLRVLRCLHERRSDEQFEAERTERVGSTIVSGCSINFGGLYEGRSWGEDIIRKSVNNGELVPCLGEGMVLDDYDGVVAIKEALRIGDLELAERLLPSGRSILDYATDCPQPEMIAKVLDGGYLHWNEQRAARALSNAAQSASCELMQQIFQLHSPFQEDHSLWKRPWYEALEAAVEGGNMPVLKWLMEHSLGREACEVMKKGSVTGGLSSTGLVYRAASKGDVEVMQYLYEKELVTMDLSAAHVVARNGQLNAVKWLLDHDLIGNQYDFSDVIDEVALYGQLEILQLIQMLDQPGGYEAAGLKHRCTESAFPLWGGYRNTLYDAARGGHVAILEWLQANYPEGCQPFAMQDASAFGHLDAVKWLHANRSEACTTSSMREAAESGYLDIVKWLYVNCPESRTTNAILTAIMYGHFRIAYWLHSKFPDYDVSPEPDARLFCVEFYEANPLEALLFVRAIYPAVFTATFVQLVRGDCTKEKSSSMVVVIRDWLEGNYPNYPSTNS